MFKCPECDHKAINLSSERQCKNVYRRYYQCTNTACGHRFRTTESFDHTISPPTEKYESLVLECLQKMPQDERQTLLASIE